MDQDESGSVVEAWSSFLSGLTEHEGKLVLFCKPVVLASLLHMLRQTSDHEVCQALVDLLQDLAEDETFSCQAIELGLIDLILARTGSGQEDLETACLDLLALLSSHPEALEQMLLPSSPLPPLLSSWLSSGTFIQRLSLYSFLNHFCSYRPATACSHCCPCVS